MDTIYAVLSNLITITWWTRELVKWSPSTATYDRN